MKATSHKLHNDGFNWRNDDFCFDEKFMKNCDEKGYILEVDVEYPKHLYDLQTYFLFVWFTYIVWLKEWFT